MANSFTKLKNKMSQKAKKDVVEQTNKMLAEKRIPFSINIPNAVTHAALEATERGEELEKISLNRLKKDWHDACVK